MTDISTLSTQIDDLRSVVLRSNPPQIMTTDECVDFLGVSSERLYQWRKEGFGPPFSQPTERTIRYLAADVIAWLKEYQDR